MLMPEGLDAVCASAGSGSRRSASSTASGSARGCMWICGATGAGFEALAAASFEGQHFGRVVAERFGIAQLADEVVAIHAGDHFES